MTSQDNLARQDSSPTATDSAADPGSLQSGAAIALLMPLLLAVCYGVVFSNELLSSIESGGAFVAILVAIVAVPTMGVSLMFGDASARERASWSPYSSFG